MDLKSFILQPRKWQWGVLDCTLFTADWVLDQRGVDPGADLRGTYDSASSANAIIASYGGIEALVDAKLSAVGIYPVDEPIHGDIGIVRCVTGFDLDNAEIKEVPAIKYGPIWAVMSARGAQVKALEWTGAAWSVA